MKYAFSSITLFFIIIGIVHFRLSDYFLKRTNNSTDRLGLVRPWYFPIIALAFLMAAIGQREIDASFGLSILTVIYSTLLAFCFIISKNEGRQGKYLFSIIALVFFIIGIIHYSMLIYGTGGPIFWGSIFKVVPPWVHLIIALAFLMEAISCHEISFFASFLYITIIYIILFGTCVMFGLAGKI